MPILFMSHFSQDFGTYKKRPLHYDYGSYQGPLLYELTYPLNINIMRKQVLLFSILLLSSTLLIGQVTNGSVSQSTVIGNGLGNFGPTLDAYQAFGSDIARLGDVDGDGVDDIAVGAPGASNNSTTDGGVWILFMNADGTVKSEQRIDATNGNLGITLPGNEALGQGIAFLGDLNGGGKPTIAIGAPGNVNILNNSADTGAVIIATLNTDGTVANSFLIRNNTGGLPDILERGEHFGYSVANIGDLNGDGRPELAVGSWGADGTRGAVYILFLRADGFVNSYQRIGRNDGNFPGTLNTNYHFGCSVTGLEDINQDGIPDMAVGAYGSDQGGSFKGAVWFLYLEEDGTVGEGAFAINGEHPLMITTLNDFDYLGWSVNEIGDLDGDGRNEVAVGAPRTNTAGSGSSEGRLYIFYMGGYGVLRKFSVIDEEEGNLQQSLGASTSFGSAVENAGDIDGDGIEDIWVGGIRGGIGGRVYRLTLNGKGEGRIEGRAMIFPDGISNPVVGGTAYLFDLYDDSPFLFGHDTTARVPVDANGNFVFEGIPLRDYYLKVEGNTDTLLGGYYKEDLDTRSRSYVSPSVLSVEGDTLLDDIFLLDRKVVRRGTSTYIMYGRSYPGNGFKTEQPTVGLPLLLSLAGTDSLIDYVTTDSAGEFALGLEDNTLTYDLIADLPGLPMDSATALSIAFPSGQDSFEIEVIIDSFAIFVNLNPSTSLNELARDAYELRMGPVPTQDVLNVMWEGNSGEAVTYRVRDMEGREVFAAGGRRGVEQQLNLATLPSGIYLLEAKSNSGVWLRKFQKE